MVDAEPEIPESENAGSDVPLPEVSQTELGLQQPDIPQTDAPESTEKEMGDVVPQVSESDSAQSEISSVEIPKAEVADSVDSTLDTSMCDVESEPETPQLDLSKTEVPKTEVAESTVAESKDITSVPAGSEEVEIAAVDHADQKPADAQPVNADATSGTSGTEDVSMDDAVDDGGAEATEVNEGTGGAEVSVSSCPLILPKPCLPLPLSTILSKSNTNSLTLRHFLSRPPLRLQSLLLQRKRLATVRLPRSLPCLWTPLLSSMSMKP